MPIVHKSDCTIQLRRIVVFLTVLFTVCSLWTRDFFASQEPLRVDVNLVNVFVTVQDESGAFVTNLNQDAFRVYEDDVVQEIRIFEKHDEVQSATGILMDSSGSMVDILTSMVRGVREFARALPALDSFFVATFGTTVKLIQDYTDSRQHLEDAVQRLRPFGTSVMYDGLFYGMDSFQFRTRNGRR